VVAISVSEARAKLPQVLLLVEAGDEVVLTRHGRDVAVIVRPDALRPRRGSHAIDAAARVRERLDAARRAPLPTEGLSPEAAESLVREIRADRDAR
jgi:antitoxin (DNA-binding transcriptional repressor) of toxin-antitoxin stability system